MKRKIALAVVVALISGCATFEPTSNALTEQTPQAAIEEAQAEQANKHTWVWWTAGILAVGALAATGHHKNDSPSDTGSGQSGQTNSVCVTTVCGP